eukprot:3761775-Amphidinium_carterae.1
MSRFDASCKVRCWSALSRVHETSPALLSCGAVTGAVGDGKGRRLLITGQAKVSCQSQPSALSSLVVGDSIVSRAYTF